MPFSDTVNTTDATSEGLGNECFDDSSSVWYRFTPSSDETVAVVVHSQYDATVEVFTGQRGSLTTVACGDDPDTAGFTASAGTTYHIRVGSYDDGGALSLTIRGVLPPLLDVGVRSVSADELTGDAIVRMAYACSRARGAWIHLVAIRQRRADDLIATGSNEVPFALTCDGKRHRRRVIMQGPFAFNEGYARVIVNATACNRWLCIHGGFNEVIAIQPA